jgi:hypothetical protein
MVMKNKLLLVGMAAASLVTAAAQAAPTAIDDSALDGIAGKNNTFAMGSTAGVTTDVASMGNDNSANVQFIWYQWGDDHGQDGSNDKGANNVQGSASQVQQNITSGVNALFWGGLGQNYLNNSGEITGDQSNMGYGTFANGGF